MSWPISRLGEVISFIRGVTFTPEDQVEPFSEGSTVVMRTKNVQVAGLDQSDLIAVPSGFVRRKEQELREGDILVSSANSWELVGKASYVPKLTYEATAGGFISIVRAKESRIDSRYLYYWVTCPSTQHKIRHCGRQTTNISNLDVGRFQDLEIPLPPLPEQKRIAAILDKADAIRRKRQQAIQFADDFLRAVFLDIFGDPVTNPKGWDEYVLKEIADIRSGVTKGKAVKPEDSVTRPYMRVANVQDGYLDMADVQHITVSKRDAEKCLLLDGDILLTEGGDPDKLGRGHVWRDEVEGCLHQNHIFSVRINDKERVRPDFLSVIISSARGERYFLKVGKQTTGIATINKTALSEFVPFVPPIALQDKYLDFSKRIYAVKQSLAEGDVELFNSLSQKAFSGRL
ncbi:restriction endonuclease subunit S [Pseudomonas aeruginosa]|uniref:restriction endonuclease subunit S n=1 Tax=Pseudomonas aeruginosa TaxID=287 RepID=UPI001559EFCD|nr:restriction endonuclease subunit S [Pseudomonas aeruginosa]